MQGQCRELGSHLIRCAPRAGVTWGLLLPPTPTAQCKLRSWHFLPPPQVVPFLKMTTLQLFLEGLLVAF